MGSVVYGTEYKLKGQWEAKDKIAAEYSGEPTCLEVNDPSAPKISFGTAGEEYYPQTMYSWHEDQLSWEIEDEIFALHVLSGPGKLEHPYQKYVTIENKQTKAIKRYKLVEITEEEYEETNEWYKSVEEKIWCEDSQWESLPTKDRIDNVDPVALPVDKDGFVINGTTLYRYDESIGGPIVHIPEGIKRINADAFRECQSITQVYIPDSVRTIGASCFCWCKNLVRVRLPEGLTKIEDYVFFSCERLQEINLPNTITFIGIDSFAHCASLEEVVLPESLVYLCDSAFLDVKGLKKVTLNDSLKEMGRAAFSQCTALVELHIPASVKEIGGGVCSGCTGLERITVAEGNEAYYSQNNCLIHRASKTLVLACNDSVIPDDGSVVRIGGAAFSNSQQIESIVLPDTVEYIEQHAFSGCRALKYITLPNTSSNSARCVYGEGLFSGCSSLEHFEIPGWMTTLSSYMFDGCASLKEIRIPATVTKIDLSAFSGCKSLTELIIPKSVTRIGMERSFGGGNGGFIRGCTSLRKLVVEDGNPVYRSKDNCIIETETGTLFAILENGVIPNDGRVTKIGRGAFCACEHIEEISLPEGITEIGQHAFSTIRNLKKIHIPQSVNTIEHDVFFDALKENKHDAIEEENGIWYVGSWAVGLAKEQVLTELNQKIWKDILDESGAITIREGTIGICANAFYHSGVISVSLPSSLRYICDGAFAVCERLKSISIPEKVEKIGDYAFNACEGLEQVAFSEGLIRIGKSAFNHCQKLQSVTIPDTVRSIGNDAFRFCEGLQSLTIPDVEVDVGNDAFGYCGDIPHVVVPERILARLTHFGADDDAADSDDGDCVVEDWDVEALVDDLPF